MGCLAAVLAPQVLEVAVGEGDRQPRGLAARTQCLEEPEREARHHYHQQHRHRVEMDPMCGVLPGAARQPDRREAYRVGQGYAGEDAGRTEDHLQQPGDGVHAQEGAFPARQVFEGQAARVETRQRADREGSRRIVHHRQRPRRVQARARPEPLLHEHRQRPAGIRLQQRPGYRRASGARTDAASVAARPSHPVPVAAAAVRRGRRGRRA